MAPPYTRNTIVLKGDLGRRHEEKRAAGVIRPGHLVQLGSADTILVHATASGKAAMLFAKEQALAGLTVNDAYASGDLVPLHWAIAGDEILARVPAAAVAIVEGDFLVSNGDGTFIKATGVLSTPLYANTAASAAVTNTVTETAFDKSYTFSANALKAGDIIRVKAEGIATATHSTDTLTIKLYIGGTAGTLVVSTGALDVADNDIFELDATLVVRTAGASGTIVGTGFYTIGAPGTATTKSFKLASTAIDTTATQQIAVSATWSVADVGNSVRLDVLTVDEERAAGGSNLAMAYEALDNSGGGSEAFLPIWVL